MPKVTVVMPVYNTNPEFLRQTIDSILNQSFRDFEFLIINDASTTNVKDVILSYNDKRIVYVENEQNLGISKTSNKALQLAKGQYIARQDHDDISEPDRLMKQVRILDENPEIGVCGCFFKVFPKIQKVKLPLHGASLLCSSSIPDSAAAEKNLSTPLDSAAASTDTLCPEEGSLWNIPFRSSRACPG